MTDDEITTQADALTRWVIKQRNAGVIFGDIDEFVFEAVASLHEAIELWSIEDRRR